MHSLWEVGAWTVIIMQYRLPKLTPFQIFQDGPYGPSNRATELSDKEWDKIQNQGLALLPLKTEKHWVPL